MKLFKSIFFLLAFAGVAKAQYVQTSPSGTQTVTQPAATSLQANTLNGVRIADNFAGSDIGQKINAAVADCVTAGIVCRIEVNQSGTISTPPELPMGFSISFNPQGSYMLSTTWLVDHRATSFFFNNAQFYYTLDTGDSAIYVGKRINATVNTSGTTVTWVSGSQFSNVDTGDTVLIGVGGNLAVAANVASATATTITTTGPVGAYTGATAVVYMGVSDGLGAYGGQGVSMSGVNIEGYGPKSNANDNAITAELTESLVLDSVQVANMGNGICLQFLGTLKSNVYSLHCNVDGSGLILSDNAIGGFHFSGSNGNSFYGVDIENGNYTLGSGVYISNSGANTIGGLLIESHSAYQLLEIENSGWQDIQIIDWENNTADSYEIGIRNSFDIHLHGPTQFESSNPNGIYILNSTDVVFDQFSIAGGYTTAFNGINSTGKLNRVTNTSGGVISAPGFTVEDVNGNFIIPNIITSGAQSLAGCAISAPAGGASAGSFLSGTTGVCTVTITPGFTAPSGWTCDAHNLTTPTNVINQTAYSTTTATLSGTTTASDRVAWKCVGF